jgi:hypothetical protein
MRGDMSCLGDTDVYVMDVSAEEEGEESAVRVDRAPEN